MILRQPKDILIDGRTLADILADHGKWLRGEGGKHANLSWANLGGADLSEADLRHAKLHGADLSGALLRVADLSDAILCDANLRNADLRGAYLRDANLRNADLRGADLSWWWDRHREAVCAVIRDVMQEDA